MMKFKKTRYTKYNLFLRFLKEEKLFNQFKNNVLNYGNGYFDKRHYITWDFFAFLKNKVQFDSFNGYDNYIQNAFPWDRTSEGVSFWMNKYMKWCDYKKKAR